MMTSRERWLAALDGEPVDRLPFWPKLNNSYPPAQAGVFQDKSLTELHDYIGSDKHQGIGQRVFRTERRQTEVRTEADGNRRVTFYKAPSGTARLVRAFDPGSQSWPPIEFPARDLASIRVLTEVENDVRLEPDAEAAAQERSKHDQVRDADAVSKKGIGESALMTWVEWWAGVENAHLLLFDYPQAVEELFAAHHGMLCRAVELECEHGHSDVLYLTENTSTTLISPQQYRDYCLPHIREYADIARRAGRRMVLHMCGHLKDLLPDFAPLPVNGFEAFTSPPVGNTRLQDGRRSCPDKCLIGGTNASLWTRPAAEIIDELAADLDQLPHHRGVVITSGGVMPPLAEPETIRRVCEWVKEYPVRN